MEFKVYDRKGDCETGDTILIKKIEEKLKVKKDVDHAVEEVIYRLGDVVDPLTKEPVVVDKYRSQLKRTSELYGKVTEYDYDTAPPRGWQAGKKDFTDKPVYRKWHNFKEDDPYSLIS